MNIVVLTYSGKTITRPSTTLEKNGHDLYLPDFVSRLSMAPALFVNVSRPGRCIGENFALRYASSLGFGCLFYPENLIDGSEEGFACASCLDHTTHLGVQQFPLESSALRLCAGEQTVFSLESFDTGIISHALSEVSRFVFIRTGDLVAIEMSERLEIPCIDRTVIRAEIKEEKVLDFQLIL